MPPACRKEVLAFASAMEAQLLKNDHKGGWSHESELWLLHRLIDEVEELKQELTRANPDPKRVLEEAADVANFAMMIADVLGALDK